MASSNVDLGRGDPGSPSGHDLASLRTANSRRPRSPDSASCGLPPATQLEVSGENLVLCSSSTGPASDNFQDPGDDHSPSVPSARPSGVPAPGNSETQGQQVLPIEPDFDHFAQFCIIYNEKAEKHDEALIEQLGSSADSLLIFVHSHAPQSAYGSLTLNLTGRSLYCYGHCIHHRELQNPQSRLRRHRIGLPRLHCSAARSNIPIRGASQCDNTATTTRPQPLVLTRSSVKVNILWILSLIFSIVSALAATLVQSWLTQYKRLVNQSPQPEQLASEHSYYFRGVVQFRLVILAEALPALLHISLFLFLAGLIVFLFPINEEIARAITGIIAAFAALYLGLTIISIFAAHAPYRTPFTAIFNPLLDIVLRCWIATVASCKSFAENHGSSDIFFSLWLWLYDFEDTCRDVYRRNVGHNYHARMFGDERRDEARDWLISQLTNIEEAEALMKVVVPNLTHPSKANTEWLKRFLLDEPLMLLRYLAPHLPSIFDSYLILVLGITSRRLSDDYDLHRHLQFCQAMALEMVQMLHIELDISFPALLSLRRLRNDRDPFIASNANTTTTLILLDVLWTICLETDGGD